MKHFLLLYTTIIAAFFVLSTDTLPTPASPELFQSAPPPCGPAAQIIDSLSLVALHNNLGGGFWLTNWTLGDPVCSWFGITLDGNGFVTEITLNSNGLFGNIPMDIGLFSRLRTLQLDNNFLTGAVPSQIGLLSNLEILFLDDNQLSGELPTSMGDLQNLQTIFLDNNFISGTVPAEMATNPNLQRFELFNNRFDSLPDFSGVPNMQNNRFKIQDNRFTFDDILPNLTPAVGNFYHPQDSICEKIDSVVAVGSTFIMDLDIDDAVGSNLYTWFKDGLPFGLPTNSNQLVISPITFGSAGSYTCEVTNTGAPLLTLYCRPTTLTVVCAPSINNMDDVLCNGQSVNVNGTNYNQFNPTGTENLGPVASTGCDSIVEVNLNFISPPVTDYSPTLCPGETETINGTVYSPSNPTGTEVFVDAIGPGCDSTVNVNLNYLASNPSSNYNETICEDDEVIINGSTYNFSNPNGIEILEDASVAGCDSFININLNFYPPAVLNYSPVLCEGESVMVNGTTYNAANPNGQEIIADVAPNSCDSIINIALTFFAPVIYNLDTTICAGGSLNINGTNYSAGNTTGSETFTDSAQNGCDSTVNINLSFFPEVIFNYSPTYCPGDAEVINGTTYNAGNPTGTEIFTGQAAIGCDSTVNINLSFFSEVIFNYSPIFCPGDAEVINGTTYNAGNPSGTEIFTGQAANGCDSTVNISLNFSTPVSSNYTPDFCPGDAEVINGTTYDSGNSSGIEVFSGMAANGCDSTVNITLNFLTEPTGNYSNTFCPGGSEFINGTTYDSANSSGTETLTAAAANGCDSIVNVNISFYPPIVFDYSPTFCAGQETVIQGTTYNAANPTGQEIFIGLGQNGCDSTVNISLTFGAAAEGDYTPTLCPNGAEIINGTTYNAANPSGAELLPGMGSGGCDSIVNVNLNFFAPIVFNYNNSLCTGSSEIINGTTYDEANPSGTEIFIGLGSNGCDSTVNINLTFGSASEGNYTPTLCSNGSEIINGTTYNSANPTGAELLPGMGSGGCDSIVNVSLNFFPELIFNYSNTLCEGGEEIINGTTYNQANPSGSEIFAGQGANGCDSTVNISLNFINEIEINYSNTLCEGGSEIINGTTYNELNPTGTETFSGLGSNGCDSIVNVALSFFPPVQTNYTNTLCEGDFEIINGTTYDELNDTGIEIFSGQAANGCDSIVNINLNFTPPSSGSYQDIICPDDNVVFNGVTFDISNPSGSVTFPAAAQNGCDSILAVDLNFYSPLTNDYNLQLCTGGSTTINGTLYDAANPSGVEIIPSLVTGCDSMINVNLTFGSSIIFDYAPDFCPGESTVINGTTYDAANPNGSETFPGMGAGGCDSTVNITLNFMANGNFDYIADICPGDQIEINGTTYDQANLNGQETLSGVAANGCDSIINVNLTLLNTTNGNYSNQLCSGDSETINGTLYNEMNPSGTEIFPGSNGCDSIVNVSLTFINGSTTNLDTTLCEGNSITVNDVIYDENNSSGIEVIELAGGCDSTIIININFSTTVSYDMNESFCDSTEVFVGMQTFGPDNPTGSVLLPGQSQNGCDSLIMVNLTYFLNNVEDYNPTLCANETFSLNGNDYDASNPTGVEILVGMGMGGCDSTVNIDLNFFPTIIDTITGPICFGENVLINGNIYDVNNPTGVEVLSAASATGCDSTVVLELNFLEELTGDFIQSFCTNAEIPINGNIYSASNPTGQELLVGQSVDGCDSLLNIDLTFGEIIELEIDTLLCEGTPLEIGEEIIESEGTYTVTLSGESSGGCDSIVTVTLTYDDPFVYGAAEAGEDQIDCTESVILEGLENPGQNGFWTSPGLAILDHINQANTGITNLQPGPNSFVWSVSSDVCLDYDQDTIVVTYLPLPVPFYDSFSVNFAVSTFELDVLANDSFPWAETPFTVTAEIDTGGLIIQENDTTLFFAPQPSYTGLIQGTYFICGTLCPDECYEQPFVINMDNDFWGKDDGWNLPNGITPNGDGSNDLFVIDPLLENPEEYENNELVIFNRYGSMVYRAQPYLNDWDGMGPQGVELPEGTYYYVFRLNLNNGEVFKGDVTIIR